MSTEASDPEGGNTEADVASGGCGLLVASCGHRGGKRQSSFTMSGTCNCGRSYSVSCKGDDCTGRNFYC